MTQVIPSDEVNVNAGQRVGIFCAVQVSRLLCHLNPSRLRRVMSAVCRNAHPASYGQTRDVRNLVLTSSARCRGDDACLVRSIAVMVMCRFRGYSPTWAVGVVAAPPFRAHAWLEAEGEVVDEPLKRKEFKALFRVSP